MLSSMIAVGPMFDGPGLRISALADFYQVWPSGRSKFMHGVTARFLVFSCFFVSLPCAGLAISSTLSARISYRSPASGVLKDSFA